MSKRPTSSEVRALLYESWDVHQGGEADEEERAAVLTLRKFHTSSNLSPLVVQLKPNIQSQQSRVLVSRPRQAGQSVVVQYLRMCTTVREQIN